MRRQPFFLLIGAGVAGLSLACGGGGDSNNETRATASPTAFVAATATPGSNLTPVSQPVTPTSTTAAPSPTAAGETPPATSTSVAQPTSQATSPPPPPPPPPTATPVPQQSGNPVLAQVGVAGSSRFVWSPNTVTVAPGGTVTWVWNEPVQPHNVVGDNFPLSSQITKSAAISHTFASPGTYTFFCETHPDTMRGKVIVQ